MANTDVPGDLALIWSARDPDVARHMVFMYAGNARRQAWWSRVRLVVWGPSAELLARDEVLQAELAELMASGVEVAACRACAERYGVVPRLEALGIEVDYMGAPLTDMLREGWRVLTF